ncbi:hypothetical protein B0H10DRAFT_1182105 [Mycena sp. CBHHK59/15]|nr:hypothetical protein B0H10DRAFT_1182105 [Mycena sp. CBHHK59/15]
MGFDTKGQLCSLPTVSAARERQSSTVPSSRESSFYSQTTTTTECSLDDPSILDEADTKARHIVQQVWAQAIKNDATFVVIHSVNYEFIGIRHRGTRTLYLSEMICLPECTPTYYKVHTGLYTASLLDAIDRAKQMKAAKNGDIPVPLSWQTYYQHNSVTVKGGNSPRPRRPAKPAKNDVTKEKTVARLCFYVVLDKSDVHGLS